MSRARWSLAGRLTTWFCLCAVVPVALAFAVGGAFLAHSVGRELVALVREELEEARVRLTGVPDPGRILDRVNEELEAHHPALRMAWRLADARTGTVLAESGHLHLLADHVPSPTPDLEPVESGASILTGSTDLGGGLVLGLVIDGSAHLALRDRYWLAAWVTSITSLVVAVFVARLLARRVAGLVREVAVRVRDDGTVDPGQGPGLPAEIQDVADELRQKLEEVRRHSTDAQLYTAGLAHELRSPIQNLLGATEVALMRPRDGDTYREVLRSQLEELHELADAVDNLLSLCTQHGTISGFDHESFDLGAEWRLRADRERLRGQRRGISLATHENGDLIVCGDREALLRAVRNVVGNAIEWSPDGGAVTVTLTGGDSTVAVDVDDAGPGIAEEHRAALFRPFARVPSRPRQRAGFGLGLAITKAAVERQGGTVEILASPGGGTRLRLSIRKRLSG